MFPWAEDPISALRQENENLRQMMHQERTPSKYELNGAKRRVQTLQEQVKTVVNNISSAGTQEPQFSWDSWKSQTPETTPSSPPQQEAAPIAPSDFDTLYQKKRVQEITYLQELSKKQQQAADEFIGNPQLAPYYNDALVEFQRIDQMMSGRPFEEKMRALHSTVGDWISRGWAPRQPFDPKRPMGGIPTGGQSGGGDNRFRPDEGGAAGQVGFYTDEMRRADAEHDRKARTMDLEARKAEPHGGSDALTYDEYLKRQAEKRK